VVAGPPVKQSLSVSGPAPRSRLLVALLATATLVACSGDDDGDTAASEDGGDEASAATVGTGSAAPGVEGFCAAVIAADTAAAGDDEAALQGALDDLTAEAPESLEETVATVVAAAGADQSLGEAYTELIGFMGDNCGFSEIALTTAAASFTGVPSAVPEGPVIFTVDNTSDVEQAVLVARINDDVTEPAAELARLPTAEAFERFVVKSSVAVAPGATAFATADLDPGRYLAAAILPEGTTPGGGTATSTSTAGSSPSPSAPSGETLGIVKEFMVS
jgi:hypothetical protein